MQMKSMSEKLHGVVTIMRKESLTEKGVVTCRILLLVVKLVVSLLMSFSTRNNIKRFGSVFFDLAIYSFPKFSSFFWAEIYQFTAVECNCHNVKVFSVKVVLLEKS